MKIGYDGKRAVSNMTGLGNYSRLVLETWGAAHPDDELAIYTPRLDENPRLERILANPNARFILPASRPLGSSVWRTWGITGTLRDSGLDLYHGLSNELPLNIRRSGIPAVVTMHDVIYRTMPHCYSAVDRRLYDLKYGRSCRLADRIVAVSECTRRDVVRFYGIDPDRIDVVYQGCDPSFRRHWNADERLELRTRYRLPERYLLQVGTIEERKNLILSVRALVNLPREVALVAVGRDRGYLGDVLRVAHQLEVADRLMVLTGVPFRDLPGLNQCAEAILYPSRYEGFGIPVLEGLESMRPVVAATGSCLEEAGGKAAWYVSPDDPTEMADLLRAILDGHEATPERLLEGKLHAARFSDAAMVAGLEAAYARTLSGR